MHDGDLLRPWANELWGGVIGTGLFLILGAITLFPLKVCH